MHTIHILFRIARAFVLVLFFILILTLSSCVKVKVHGFLSDNLEAPEKPKIFVYTNPQASNPILATEVASKISNLLIKKGYSVVSEIKESDAVILFEIGLGGTRTIVRSSSVSKSKINIYTGQLETVPTTTTSSSTQNLRYLTLYYYKSENFSDTSMPIWVGEVRSYGSSSDLRFVSGYLIVAGFEHFLEDTERELKKTYLSGDKKLSILKNEITKVEKNN